MVNVFAAKETEIAAGSSRVIGNISRKMTTKTTIMIIPEPVHYESTEGHFVLTEAAGIFSENSCKKASEILRQALQPSTGFSLPDVTDARAAKIRITEVKGQGVEGYQLEVTASGIEIRASAEAGWFYAIQTLRQLLPPAIFRSGPVTGMEWTVPCVKIEDRPRFGWRGMMLDTARHYFPVDDIKRFLDQMAQYKYNVFHWHLVDDQGWRLEIKRYPRLVEIGSKRAESPRPGNRNEGDGIPHGGYYSQEEVRNIVSYATERHIMVVPEIEMPGHSGAAIAAYPELGNADVPNYQPEVKTRWGVNPYIYAPSGTVFEFLQNVLLEVFDLFPSAYIHIGGDEAPKEQWKQSTVAQTVMQQEGIETEEQLQSWFLRRMEEFLSSHGKRLIGWDEIQEGGLSPNATMMLWRDWKWARAALNAGNSVIMTPASHCYLDYSQGPIETEPEAICGELRLETTYSFEPIPDGIVPGADARVLGIQGNVWTEYIRDRDYLDFMTWPRAAALAEIAWSPKEGRSWETFSEKILRHTRLMEEQGIRFRPLDFKS